MGILYEFAFPNNYRAPSEPADFAEIELVAGDISIEFLLPEADAAFRVRGVPASTVAVPEASMHEGFHSMFFQDYVRPSQDLCSLVMLSAMFATGRAVSVAYDLD